MAARGCVTVSGTRKPVVVGRGVMSSGDASPLSVKPAGILAVKAGSSRMRRMFRHTLLKHGVCTDDSPIQVCDDYRPDGSVVADGIEYWHVWALDPDSLLALRDYPFCVELTQNVPVRVFHSQGTGPEKIRGSSRTSVREVYKPLEEGFDVVHADDTRAVYSSHDDSARRVNRDIRSMGFDVH